MPRRDPFRKLPHRPSDYGAASPSDRSVDPSISESQPGQPPHGSTDQPLPPPALLQQFKAERPRKPTHPRERILLLVVSTHLAFLPWALGTVHVWSQAISCMLSALSFVLALLPRTYSAELTGGETARGHPFPKLVRFPIFWIGLGLLGLVLIQALNPAWAYRTDGKMWWMTAIPHVTWLPTGVRVPFAGSGPWRDLIIYASAWLTVCAIWVGFTRRRTIQRLFLVIAINAVAVCGLGLAERITGATEIFWSVKSSNAAFFASFIYKNHAGAYLLLAVTVTCALAAWYYVRGVRRFEKSNPSALFAFLATCIAVSVLVSYARGATLVMMVYLSCVVVGFVWFQWRLPAAARRPLVAIAMLLVFGFFLKTGLNALNSDLAWDRLRSALSGNDVSVEARQTADHASFDMLKDHWKMGVGSGSWPYLFTVYQRRYPAIWIMSGRPAFWPHAHNDILEFPTDLGIPGMLLIIAAFAYWFIALMRVYAWQNPLSLCAIVGCLCVVGMSWGDFIFEDPAVLITWCALWPASTLWAQFEEQRRA